MRTTNVTRAIGMMAEDWEDAAVPVCSTCAQAYSGWGWEDTPITTDDLNTYDIDPCYLCHTEPCDWQSMIWGDGDERFILTGYYAGYPDDVTATMTDEIDDADMDGMNACATELLATGAYKEITIGEWTERALENGETTPAVLHSFLPDGSYRRYFQGFLT